MTMKCYLFDMNGTIRDDLMATFNSTNDVLREFGRPPVSLSTYRRLDETDFWKLYRSLGFMDSDGDRVGELFRHFFHTRYEGMVKAFPAVVETVKHLREEGALIGVVSHMRNERLDFHVQECGLAGLVDVRIGRGDTEEDKPSPQPLLEAYKRLGISPDWGSYTGDKLSDIEAAHAAGTLAVAISHRGAYHTERMLRVANPDRVIRKFSSLLYI